MSYVTITTEVDIDVDIDDVLYEMSTHEKEELCQSLIEDGYGPGVSGEHWLAETYTDQQLIQLFNDMWANRIHIDLKQIDQLRSQLEDQKLV